MCPGDDEDSMSVITTDVSTSHTITVQQEDSDYIITVAAINVAGTSALSNAVTAMTREAGEILCVGHRTLLKLKGCFNSSKGCFTCSSIKMLCACFLQPAPIRCAIIIIHELVTYYS